MRYGNRFLKWISARVAVLYNICSYKSTYAIVSRSKSRYIAHHYQVLGASFPITMTLTLSEPWEIQDPPIYAAVHSYNLEEHST